MNGQINHASLLSVAKEAALKGGETAKRMFYEPRQTRDKGPRDLVTDADLAAQAIITSTIREAFPDHGFLTEEEDEDLPQEGPILWVIDPIDGTVNYSRGVPIFCVSIAAVWNTPPLTADHVVAAVVYDPMLDEMFTAIPGAPALLEESPLHAQPLQVSITGGLPDALVGLDWALDNDTRAFAVQYVNQFAGAINVFRSLGSATLAMAWVAAGRLDAYANFQLKPWDVAAAALIIHQAGGQVSDMHGRPLRLDPAGLNCLVSNGHLHADLVAK